MENFKEEYNQDEAAFEGEFLNGAEFMEYEDDDDDEEMVAEYEDDDDDDESALSELDYDDDEESAEYEDDDDDDDEADPEFFGALAGLAAPLITKGISGAIRGVSGLLRKKPSRRVRSYGRGRRPRIHRGRIGRIPSISRLTGTLRTPRGRRLPIKLPKNVATKRDVLVLRKSISANRRIANTNTKRVGRVILDLKKARAHVNSVDKKHTKASRAQNRVIGGINKKLVRVNKDVEKTKDKMQMNQMLSMFMSPELEKFEISKFTAGPDVANPHVGAKIEVTKPENKDNNLGLMMAMSGGMGGDSDMNPMMMYFMFNQ